MAWAFFVIGTTLLLGVPGALLTMYLSSPPPPLYEADVRRGIWVLITASTVLAFICYALAASTYC